MTKLYTVDDLDHHQRSLGHKKCRTSASIVVKLHEITFVMVDHVMEMTAWKSCKYCEYGSFEGFLSLFCLLLVVLSDFGGGGLGGGEGGEGGRG